MDIHQISGLFDREHFYIVTLPSFTQFDEGEYALIISKTTVEVESVGRAIDGEGRVGVETEVLLSCFHSNKPRASTNNFLNLKSGSLQSYALCI